MKTIKITETQLKNVIKEMMDVSSDSEYYQQRRRPIEIPFDDVALLYALAKNFCSGRFTGKSFEGLPDCQQAERLADEYWLKFG